MLIVDDVISAGTSVRESVELIRQHGAQPCGVAIALDRMERGSGTLSAVQEVSQSYGMPVISISRSGQPDRLSAEATRRWRKSVRRLPHTANQYGVK